VRSEAVDTAEAANSAMIAKAKTVFFMRSSPSPMIAPIGFRDAVKTTRNHFVRPLSSAWKFLKDQPRHRWEQ
jgi:hypothetical protein